MPPTPPPSAPGHLTPSVDRAYYSQARVDALASHPDRDDKQNAIPDHPRKRARDEKPDEQTERLEKRRATSDGDDVDKESAAGIDKLLSSSAGSSGEEADIDSCSGGSGSGETAARRMHKVRAAVMCKDGHVPPAVHQHQGDCMVASRLLALWNAGPMAMAGGTVQRKQTGAGRAKAAAPVPC